MKKSLQITFFFLLIQFISFGQDPVIQTIIDQTNIDSLTYFVEELSGEVQTIIGGSTIHNRFEAQKPAEQ